MSTKLSIFNLFIQHLHELVDEFEVGAKKGLGLAETVVKEAKPALGNLTDAVDKVAPVAELGLTLVGQGDVAAGVAVADKALDAVNAAAQKPTVASVANAVQATQQAASTIQGKAPAAPAPAQPAAA